MEAGGASTGVRAGSRSQAYRLVDKEPSWEGAQPSGGFLCMQDTQREATGLFPDMGWGLPRAREDVARSRGKREEKERAERR